MKILLDKYRTSVFHAKNVIGFYVFGGMVSFFIHGIDAPMIIQVILGMICILSLDRSFNQININPQKANKANIIKADLWIIFYFLFIVGHYLVYNSFRLAQNFNWWLLLWSIISIWFTIILVKVLKSMHQAMVAISINTKDLLGEADSLNNDIDLISGNNPSQINKVLNENSNHSIKNFDAFLKFYTNVENQAMVIDFLTPGDFINIYRAGEKFHISIPYYTERMQNRIEKILKLVNRHSIEIDKSSSQPGLLVCFTSAKNVEGIIKLMREGIGINDSTPMKYGLWANFNK